MCCQLSALHWLYLLLLNELWPIFLAECARNGGLLFSPHLWCRLLAACLLAISPLAEKFSSRVHTMTDPVVSLVSGAGCCQIGEIVVSRTESLLSRALTHPSFSRSSPCRMHTEPDPHTFKQKVRFLVFSLDYATKVVVCPPPLFSCFLPLCPSPRPPFFCVSPFILARAPA